MRGTMVKSPSAASSEQNEVDKAPLEREAKGGLESRDSVHRAMGFTSKGFGYQGLKGMTRSPSGRKGKESHGWQP